MWECFGVFRVFVENGLGDAGGGVCDSSPAGHEHRFVSVKLLPSYKNGDVGEDVPAPQAIEVEEHVTCMASELDAAVCCATHAIRLCGRTQMQFRLQLSLKTVRTVLIPIIDTDNAHQYRYLSIL